MADFSDLQLIDPTTVPLNMPFTQDMGTRWQAAAQGGGFRGMLAKLGRALGTYAPVISRVAAVGAEAAGNPEPLARQLADDARKRAEMMNAINNINQQRVLNYQMTRQQGLDALQRQHLQTQEAREKALADYKIGGGEEASDIRKARATQKPDIKLGEDQTYYQVGRSGLGTPVKVPKAGAVPVPNFTSESGFGGFKSMDLQPLRAPEPKAAIPQMYIEKAKGVLGEDASPEDLASKALQFINEDKVKVSAAGASGTPIQIPGTTPSGQPAPQTALLNRRTGKLGPPISGTLRTDIAEKEVGKSAGDILKEAETDIFNEHKTSSSYQERKKRPTNGEVYGRAITRLQSLASPPPVPPLWLEKVAGTRALEEYGKYTAPPAAIPTGASTAPPKNPVSQAAAGGKVTVVAPDGVAYHFANQAAADAFKQSAGIK